MSSKTNNKYKVYTVFKAAKWSKKQINAAFSLIVQKNMVIEEERRIIGTIGRSASPKNLKE